MVRMSMVHVSAHACVSVCYSMCVVLELCGLCSLMDGWVGGCIVVGATVCMLYVFVCVCVWRILR